MTEQVATDVLIVGGGPVGGVLALGLRGSGLNVTVLEAREAPEPQSDPRAIALSEGSRLILQRLGVWEALVPHAAPIRTIHISQKGRFGRTLLRASDYDKPVLGYVVGYRELAASINNALEQSGATVLRGARATRLEPGQANCRVTYERDNTENTVEAQLAAVADGGRSLQGLPGMVREVKEYGQSALVAMVKTENPHNGVAYERFTPQGPVALLPWGERDFALVWTNPPEQAEALCQLDEAVFLQQLQTHFGERVGAFLAASGRAAYPLKLAKMKPNTAPHLVVIGNAAQTLHPVAGQGFNLGIRDAWELANLAREADMVGSPEMLGQYMHNRRWDTGGGMFFTDFLVRAFSNDWPGLGHVRGAALALLDVCHPARDFVVRKMSLGVRG